ncbi:phasin family protein [Glaciimonas sp. GG7]
MPTSFEQLTNTLKTHAQAQHAITADLGNQAGECVAELMRLNTDLVKATLAESTAAAKELLSAPNSQDAYSVGATHIKREMQSAIYYGSEVMRLASDMQTARSKAMVETIAEAGRRRAELMTEWTKNITLNSQQISDMFKSTWETTRDAYTNAAHLTDEAATEQSQPAMDTIHPASRKKGGDQTARTTH